jgi:hypothetical protein
VTAARRTVTAVELFVVPVATLATILSMGTVFANRLPHPMAVHWGTDGAPNGSADSILKTSIGLWVVGAVILAVGVSAARQARSAKVDPWLISAGTTAGAFFAFALDAGISVTTIQANLDVADWTQARPIGSFVWVFVAAAVAACLGAGLAAFAARRE